MARLVAEAGLAAGYSLEAVLPFARAEYSLDFATPDSRSTFEQLLGRASAVFELDGVSEEVAKGALELAAGKLPIATKFVKRYDLMGV